MRISNRFLIISCMVFAFCFPTCISLFSADNPAGVIGRTGWSFDRSQLDWYPDAKPDEQKAKGILQHVAGWTEYDFEIPADGWYELLESGVDPSWPRDIFIDGKMLFYMSHSAHKTRMDDVIKYGGRELAKEANLWLTKGKHSLRYQRTTFPACLPSYWELRPAGMRPEACIRATGTGRDVIRAGEKLSFVFSGGTSVPLAYDLLARDMTSKELLPAGHVEFPASTTPQEKKVEIVFPRQGDFQLIARCGNALLKPADLKAGTFTVIDTKNAPPPAAELKTTAVIAIDCVGQTINGKPVEPGVSYFENRCRTEVVKRPFGSYRELTPDQSRVAPLTGGKILNPDEQKKRDSDTSRNLRQWGCEAFAYKFDLPEANQLYRMQVDYPDDDRRTMGFHLQDFPEQRNSLIQAGGVETGDHYPISQSMQTHEAYFFCRNPKGLVLPVVNLLPGWKAAAAKIRIDKVEGALPAAPAGESRGRLMGFYFEEPGRWETYFGADPRLPTSFETMERWARWNRHLGSNLLFPTVMCYNGIMWPSRVAQGWGTVEGKDTPLMLALVAEKYGQKIVPETYLSVNIMGLDPKKNPAEFDEVVMRGCEGETKTTWLQHTMNPIHPKVQKKYLDLIGELADNLKDSPAFAGISCRLMMGWQWAGYNALPGLKFGYEDWTIALFQKETGIAVPGKADDPKRFRQRFDYLSGVKREEWLDWRCKKVFAFHQRLRDRIRQAKPDARLFLNYFGPGPREAVATDMFGQMREVGMDPKLYEKEPGFVVIQGGMYGRRYSSPLMDAGVIEPSLYSPQAKQVGRWGDRGYSLYTSYFEYGHAAEFDRLGGKDVFINECCVPSGFNERELYAIALADCDTSFLINGGAGWMFGTASVMQPFLREYRALPAIPFTPWEKARDPVAVWQSRKSDQSSVNSNQLSAETKNKNQITDNFFFYAVNRLPVKVTVSIMIDGTTEVMPAPGGKPLALAKGALTFELEPYMLKSFMASEKCKLTDCRVQTPAGFAEKVAPLPAFAKQLSADLTQHRVSPELSEKETSEAVAILDAAVAGFAKGEYWKAWRIDSLPLVKIYSLTGRFPPGMWNRSVPHGLTDRADAPKLQKVELSGNPNEPKENQSRNLSGFTQLKVHAGAIHYLSQGKLWRLATDSDQAMLVYAPQPAEPVFDSFAFSPNGDLYLASHYRGKSRGVNLYRARKTDAGYGALEYLNGGKPLYEAWYMAPNDIEVDLKGNVILRLYDPENNPHGRKVSVFRWSPESGKSERILEVGTATADYGDYGLCQTQDGGLLVAGAGTRSIWRLAPDGKTLWSKSYQERYIPGNFDCRKPMGVTMDSKARIWVTDTARHIVMCFSGNGDYLASYGHYGKSDDSTGVGFSSPVGVAVLKDAKGAEWLYVADVGNKRIVKFMIK